jgi:hypothetical protein
MIQNIMWNVIEDKLTSTTFAVETSGIKTVLTANFDRDNLLFYINIKSYPKAFLI